MTKRTKNVLKILGAGLLALLLSLCLLGVTFSRYTVTVEGGSDSVGVALWKVNSLHSGGYFGKMSSSCDAYSVEAARRNESVWTYTGSVKNKTTSTQPVWEFSNVGSVPAEITFSMEGEDFTWASDFEWDMGWTTGSGLTIYQETANWYYQKSVAQWEDEAGIAYTQEEFEELVVEWGVLSLEFGEMDESGDIVPVEETEVILGAGETKGVYARVVWKSVWEGDLIDNEGNEKTVPGMYRDSEGNVDWKLFSDDVDTVLMTFLSSVDFYASWYAVQAETVLDIA